MTEGKNETDGHKAISHFVQLLVDLFIHLIVLDELGDQGAVCEGKELAILCDQGMLREGDRTRR